MNMNMCIAVTLEFVLNCYLVPQFDVTVPIYVCRPDGWPNELRVCLAFWKIWGFELTGSNPGSQTNDLEIGGFELRGLNPR